MIKFSIDDRIYLIVKYDKWSAGKYLNIGNRKEPDSIDVSEVSVIINSGIGKLIKPVISIDFQKETP